MKTMHDPPLQSAISTFHLIGQVGMTMVTGILAGLWAGIKLDAWLGGRGILTALGILAGLLAGAGATGLLLYRSLPWKH